MAAAKVKASPHLEGKYKVVHVVPGPVKTPDFGIVDLRTISLEVADKLHTRGFIYLQKINSRKKAASVTNAKE